MNIPLNNLNIQWVQSWRPLPTSASEHGFSDHILLSLSALNMMNALTANARNSVNVPRGGLGCNGKIK
jgi:hypothetical protein